MRRVVTADERSTGTRRKTKVSVAVLVAAACVYFMFRAPWAESPRMATVEPTTANGALEGDPEPIVFQLTRESLLGAVADLVRTGPLPLLDSARRRVRRDLRERDGA